MVMVMEMQQAALRQGYQFDTLLKAHQVGPKSRFPRSPPIRQTKDDTNGFWLLVM
jgi:hypothetical protein